MFNPCPPAGLCMCAASPATNTRPTPNLSTIRVWGLQTVSTLLPREGNRCVRKTSKPNKVAKLDIRPSTNVDECLDECFPAGCGGKGIELCSCEHKAPAPVVRLVWAYCCSVDVSESMDQEGERQRTTSSLCRPRCARTTAQLD